jgi:hypothetical protein
MANPSVKNKVGMTFIAKPGKGLSHIVLLRLYHPSLHFPYSTNTIPFLQWDYSF